MTAVRRGRSVIEAGSQVDPPPAFPPHGRLFRPPGIGDDDRARRKSARGHGVERLNRGRNPPIGHGPRLSARLFFSLHGAFPIARVSHPRGSGQRRGPGRPALLSRPELFAAQLISRVVKCIAYLLQSGDESGRQPARVKRPDVRQTPGRPAPHGRKGPGNVRPRTHFAPVLRPARSRPVAHRRRHRRPDGHFRAPAAARALPPSPRHQGDGRPAAAAHRLRRGPSARLPGDRQGRGPALRPALPARRGALHLPGPLAPERRPGADRDHEGSHPQPGRGVRTPAEPGPGFSRRDQRPAAGRAPPASEVLPAGDARGRKPGGLRRPRPRRQHQGPQIGHPPGHGRLDQGHPQAHGHLLQPRLPRRGRGAARGRGHHGPQGPHRHRVLRPLPLALHQAHLGAARPDRHPGFLELPLVGAGPGLHGPGPRGLQVPRRLRP